MSFSPLHTFLLGDFLSLGIDKVLHALEETTDSRSRIRSGQVRPRTRLLTRLRRASLRLLLLLLRRPNVILRRARTGWPRGGCRK